MGYSTRYIMNELARGRPMPKGRPEDVMFRALETLSNMDVSRAIHAGASPAARNHRGQGALEVLAKAALERGRHQGLGRAAACLEALNRAGRPPIGRGDHAARVLALAGKAAGIDKREQVRWFHAWLHCATDVRVWTLPDRDGATALEAWQASADPYLLKALERVAPRPPQATPSKGMKP